MKITEIDAETNEIIERSATVAEISQNKLDEATWKTEREAIQATATAKAALLQRLGITADEAALLVQ